MENNSTAVNSKVHFLRNGLKYFGFKSSQKDKVGYSDDCIKTIYLGKTTFSIPNKYDEAGSSSSTSEIGGNIPIPERGQWSGKLDFLFSCISYAVGLGNVWRFPYLCYENGGGAFLFPYLVCLVSCAIPAFFMEVAIGQYLSMGGIGIWNLVPIFKGVGFASMTIVGLYNIYYIIIVAWILFYLVASFSAILPWQQCSNYWNTENCADLNYHNESSNSTVNISVSPVVEFWERRVLGITDGIHDIGSLRWELVLGLFVASTLVYIVIYRGLHQSGKIIWVTALFPYVILSVLFFRGITLAGAFDGLLFYITPVWSKLLDPKVWVTAGTQVFFTFGIGFGSVITLGSYNKFHHNFFKDAFILCFVNPATSIFAGSVIFSVLGHMSYVQGKTVSEVVKSGPGLAFLTYPEVVLQLPLSPLWSVLFFLMLLILGVDSQFCTVEALIAGIADEWADVIRPVRKLFTLSICFLLFILGLPMVTEGGMYIFQLMDYYSASGITLLFTVFFQTIAISWIYGAKRLANNIKEMTGHYPNKYFILGWTISVPLITFGIFIFSVIRYKPLIYANVYSYPWWGSMMGWMMALASMIWIPAYAIYFLLNQTGTLKERLISGITPCIKPEQSLEEKPLEKTPLSEIPVVITPSLHTI